MDIQKVNLLSLQPSQLYISDEKLKSVKNFFLEDKKFDPIPIKNLNNRIIITDGHTRVFYLYKMGYTIMNTVWDTDLMDWEMYQICVDWCIDDNIYSINNLENRVINEREYEIIWLNRCKLMQKKLLKKRNNVSL